MHCSRHNNMSLLWITGLCVTALVVVRISNWWYRWSNPKSNGKYGRPLFRTSILGVNTVISTDMDVNLDILRHENEYFNLSYPDGLVKPLGKESVEAGKPD
uniref:Uncharacterized protein n=1 Tax=Brassica oleracea var. oleracea TaxID=109376 RepID=A0A0D3AZT7_BRAOL